MTLTSRNFWAKYQGTKAYLSPKTYRIDAEIIKEFHPFLEMKRGGRFIELGCGNSYILPYVGDKYGFELYGVDYELGRMERARHNLEQVGQTANLMCADFRNAICQVKCDIVYAGGLLEHFENPAEIVGVFANYLKEDGLMIVTVPHMKGFWGALEKAIDKEVAASYISMDLDDLKAAHDGMKIVYAAYFRWMDFSVLNYGRLPVALRKLVTAAILGFDYVVPRLRWPETFFSDMIVVSRKC